MKIKKNSWHYRFMKDSLGGDPNSYDPVSLCPYMRRLFLVFLLNIGAYGLFSLALMAIVNTLAFFLLGFMYGFVIPGQFIVVSLTAVAMFLLAGIFVMVCYMINSALKSAKKAANDHQDNLFIAYGKSLHDKVCPHVEYEDK